MNLCIGIPVLGIILYSFFKYKHGIGRGLSEMSWQEELGAAEIFSIQFCNFRTRIA